MAFSNLTRGIFDFLKREPIDPFAYSHRCDNSATYVPKKRTTRVEAWQKVSDTTGRGFGEPARKVPGCVKGTFHGFKESLPRPNMNTILTQNAPNLDNENRFYEDNKKRMNSMLVYDIA